MPTSHNNHVHHRRTLRYHIHGRDRGVTHNKRKYSAKKAMKGTKHNLNYRQLTTRMPSGFDRKREKRIVKQKYRRDMKKALGSMNEYEKYHGKRTDDSSLKGVSRGMMNIVEDISEKGFMNENQYLDMMNLLLEVHKQATEEPEVSSRDLWYAYASEYNPFRQTVGRFERALSRGTLT